MGGHVKLPRMSEQSTVMPGPVTHNDIPICKVEEVNFGWTQGKVTCPLHDKIILRTAITLKIT